MMLCMQNIDDDDDDDDDDETFSWTLQLIIDMAYQNIFIVVTIVTSFCYALQHGVAPFSAFQVFL